MLLGIGGEIARRGYFPKVQRKAFLIMRQLCRVDIRLSKYLQGLAADASCRKPTANKETRRHGRRRYTLDRVILRSRRKVARKPKRNATI